MLEAKHRDQENLCCVSFSAEFAPVGSVDHVLFKSDEICYLFSSLSLEIKVNPKGMLLISPPKDSIKD